MTRRAGGTGWGGIARGGTGWDGIARGGTTPREEADEVDSADMMGLRSRAATLIVIGIALYLLTGILLARVGVAESAVLGVIAAATIAAIVVVFRSHGPRLPVRACGAVVALTVGGAVLATLIPSPWADPRVHNWIGTGWVVVQSYTASRGRTGWALTSVLGCITVGAVGAVLSGGDPTTGLGDHLSRLPILLMAAVFGLAIARRARLVAALRRRSRQMTEEKAWTTAVLVARDERLDQVRRMARPMLQRIASGEEFDDASRLDVAVLEAHLRDTIRAPALTGGELDAVVEAARRRGVTVALLDDGGAATLDPGAAGRMRAIAADRVAAAEAGRVVVRVLPPGRDEVLSFAGDASPGPRGYTAADLGAGSSAGAGSVAGSR